jgi:hypothetical protein
MPTYRPRLNPEQIAKREARRKAHRDLRIKTLREYAAGWKDPATREKLLARSAFGRRCIKERKELRSRTLQKFLTKQPSRMTKQGWTDLLAASEQELKAIMRSISPGTRRQSFRAKTSMHLFRTMVREGLLTLDLESSSYLNNYRVI